MNSDLITEKNYAHKRRIILRVIKFTSSHSIYNCHNVVILPMWPLLENKFVCERTAQQQCWLEGVVDP